MLQAKLLRVLEEQTFRRLGGLKDIHLDLRVIAATNKNLREAVKEGAFRQDLYFRLNVIQILIPPLRDRSEDIVPMTRFFIEHYNRKFKRHIEKRQRRRHQTPDGPRLARQRARTAQRHRTRHDPGREFRDHRRQPADRDHAARQRRNPQRHQMAPKAPVDALSLEDNERSLLVRAWKRQIATRLRPPACCTLPAIPCVTR
jgi:transcriptional regulator with GAF, ATPase, and Fis domain